MRQGPQQLCTSQSQRRNPANLLPASRRILPTASFHTCSSIPMPLSAFRSLRNLSACLLVPFPLHSDSRAVFSHLPTTSFHTCLSLSSSLSVFTRKPLSVPACLFLLALKLSFHTCSSLSTPANFALSLLHACLFLFACRLQSRVWHVCPETSQPPSHVGLSDFAGHVSKALRRTCL